MLEGLKKTTKNLRIAGVRAEIRTELLPDINLERYRYADPLGSVVKFCIVIPD
jgi:hypothetical protein